MMTVAVFSMLEKFLNDIGGNYALTTAMLLPVLVGGVGLAVDYSTLTSAHSKLQEAADAAVLAAAKAPKTNAQRRQVFEQVLQADAGAGMKVSKMDLVVEDGDTSTDLTGTATAEVNLFFLHQVGKRSVSVLASTSQSVGDIAISLVLDNTGSMGKGGIDALKKASHALVDAVEKNAGPRTNVHMAVVPFVTAVNVKGEGFDERWIDKDGKALYNGWTFLDDNLRKRRIAGERLVKLPHTYADAINGKPQACKNQGNGAPALEKRERCQEREQAKTYPHGMKLFELSGTTWKGCVEARPGPYNLDLTAPSASKPDTLFVPYFAPDEPGAASAVGGNDASVYNNNWLNDMVTGPEDQLQRSTLKYVNPEVNLTQENQSTTRGPNRSCPTPITPTTTDLRKVRKGIDAMQFWNGSGTNIAEGLAWGWRVLTPNAPYPVPATMKSKDISKYIVLMTDGRNVSFGASGKANKSDYGSYGFLTSGRIDGASDQGKAEVKLNEWTLKLCADVKKQDIEIFTVVYNETATSVHNMFKECASKPGNFHMAHDTAGLEAAFAKIGSSLFVLRLTQ
jgi:Flp pilus assembly protein TadG